MWFGAKANAESLALLGVRRDKFSAPGCEESRSCQLQLPLFLEVRTQPLHIAEHMIPKRNSRSRFGRVFHLMQPPARASWIPIWSFQLTGMLQMENTRQHHSRDVFSICNVPLGSAENFVAVLHQ